MIEADFHREYGIDLTDADIQRGKTWRWFVVRLTGLSTKALTRLSLGATTADQEGDSVDELDQALGVRR